MIGLKTIEQIDGIRKSCHLLSQMFKEIAPMVQEGVSTLEVDQAVRDFLLRYSARSWFLGYEGYPATICISINEEVIHGIPGKRKFKDGDVVGLDCGIELDGYFSDAAVTLPVGKINASAKNLLAVTRECLEYAIAAVKPGNRIHDISRAVYDHAHKHGYGVVKQFCGHGVGLAPHEEPQIPNYVYPGQNPRLLPGMVLAIEPMINMGNGDVRILGDDWTVVTVDKSISAHFEHTVAVTQTGVEVLTSWESLVSI